MLSRHTKVKTGESPAATEQAILDTYNMKRGGLIAFLCARLDISEKQQNPNKPLKQNHLTSLIQAALSTDVFCGMLLSHGITDTGSADEIDRDKKEKLLTNYMVYQAYLTFLKHNEVPLPEQVLKMFVELYHIQSPPNPNSKKIGGVIPAASTENTKHYANKPQEQGEAKKTAGQDTKLLLNPRRLKEAIDRANQFLIEDPSILWEERELEQKLQTALELQEGLQEELQRLTPEDKDKATLPQDQISLCDIINLGLRLNSYIDFISQRQSSTQKPSAPEQEETLPINLDNNQPLATAIAVESAEEYLPVAEAKIIIPQNQRRSMATAGHQSVDYFAAQLMQPMPQEAQNTYRLWERCVNLLTDYQQQTASQTKKDTVALLLSFLRGPNCFDQFYDGAVSWNTFKNSVIKHKNTLASHSNNHNPSTLWKKSAGENLVNALVRTIEHHQSAAESRASTHP